MERVELKMRGLSGQFPVVYTKKMVEMLGNPELSIEITAGQPCDDVSKLLQSLGYQIVDNKTMDGWVMLRAVKGKQKTE